MNKSIWKFQINSMGMFSIEMPKGAEILTVQVQNNIPCIWAIVDLDTEKENRNFEVLGTGGEVRPEIGFYRSYVNTFQLEGGRLVFHLFETFN